MVIQESKIFNETPLKYDRCTAVLVKLIYLCLQRGIHFGERDATNVFFSITKAFQSRDTGLRRMVYLMIKELSGSAQDTIMVISSLMQDMSAHPLYRAAAIRALGNVVDASMISGVERVMRQAIGDSSPSVASSALSAAIHFYLDTKNIRSFPDSISNDDETSQDQETNAAIGRDIVRRWLSDVQSVLQASSGSRGSSPIAQYHSLGLLYLVKQTDRLALTKLVHDLSGTIGSHPMATCLALRVYGDVIRGQTTASTFDPRPFLMRAKVGARKGGEMVAIEATRLVMRNTHIFGLEVVDSAIAALQTLLASTRPVLRHAAVRIINEALMINEVSDYKEKLYKSLSNLNPRLEALVADSNRTVATLAITALLKTGDGGSVDRLLIQIGRYVGEISDDHRLVVVDAVRALSIRFPEKHGAMLDFLGGTLLREEGGASFKHATVEAICDILPSARDAALVILSDFVEDCEYPELTAHILYLFGEEGSRSSDPSALVRHLYNRLVLEDSKVRMAALGALAKIATVCPKTSEGVIAIIRRSSFEDPDDIVRDRACILLSIIEPLSESCMLDHKIAMRNDQKTIGSADFQKSYDITASEVIDIPSLEKYLDNYLNDTSKTNDDFSRFDFAAVPRIQKDSVFVTSQELKPETLVEASNTNTMKNDWELTQNILPPKLSYLGTPLYTSNYSPLTEKDTELLIMIRLLVFSGKLVLDFKCINTVHELVLEDVSINLAHNENLLSIENIIPIDEPIRYDHPQNSYIILACQNSVRFPECIFNFVLHFMAREIDPITGEIIENRATSEEYPIDQFELTIANFLAPRIPDPEIDFQTLTKISSETFELPEIKTIPDAIKAISDLFTIQPFSLTDRENEINSGSQTFIFSGTAISPSTASINFSMKTRFAILRSGSDVTVETTVASSDIELSKSIIGIFC